MERHQSPLSQYGALTEAVKLILKRKKLTYADLAVSVGMSESGIKKLLTAKDGSIGRLEAICQAMGITLLDLVQTANAELPVQEIKIPDEVQEYLVANMACFKVYWALVYDEVPVAEAAQYLGQTEIELQRHLRQLDRLGLIKAGIDGKVGLPRKSHHIWVGDGPLMRHLRTIWTRSVLDDADSTNNDDDHHLSLRFLRLSAASRADLRKAVAKLNHEFGNRSLHERLVCSDSELSYVRFLTATATGSFLKRTTNLR